MKSKKKKVLVLELNEEETSMLNQLAKAQLEKGTGLHHTVRQFIETLELATS